VRLSDGQLGEIVALGEHSEEPGLYEVPVRMPDGSVDSWDSDAVTIDEGGERLSAER
jgi:hypothetical protein